MSRGVRAFLLLALLTLPVAAVLHLLALLGNGRVWAAMVHLVIFGWISAMIIMVNYHTMPVFSGREFPYPRLILAHCGVLAAGLALAVSGMLAELSWMVSMGLAFEIIAALLFSANIVLLFRRGSVRGPVPRPAIPWQREVDRIGTRATGASGMSLPVALVLLLAVQSGWIGGQWVLAAEHLAAVGWIMFMICGVAYHVLPRFSGRGTRGPVWANAQVACHSVSVILMVLALGFGWTLVFAIGGLLMSVAIGLFIWTIWPTIQAAVGVAVQPVGKDKPYIRLEERQ